MVRKLYNLCEYRRTKVDYLHGTKLRTRKKPPQI